MDGKKILLIDDDVNMHRVLHYSLSRAGAEVFLARDGEEGLRQFQTNHPDLVIIDIMMPCPDGYETCRRIRQQSAVPIIMLTARSRDEDIVRGLEYGADDYVTKPFSVKVLMARMRAALRRASQSPTEPKPMVYSDGYLTIDLDKKRVVADGKPVQLTATEYQLLALMVENAGRVLSPKQILERVWGWEYLDDVDYVRVYIWHLRQKLEKDPARPKYLLNDHGLEKQTAN